MTSATRPPRQDPPKADDRKARLAAALKANIARRKGQAAARAVANAGQGDPDHAADDTPDTQD